jgi:hypothetical protein
VKYLDGFRNLSKGIMVERVVVGSGSGKRTRLHQGSSRGNLERVKFILVVR